jgi:molybdate transport system ATP-binding protein
MLEVVARKQFKGFTLDVNFVTEQNLIVLFGPSGSGKSLTLQIIAGTLQADRGRVSIDGQLVYDSSLSLLLPPQTRRIGYVPQQYALFPHLTVEKNISFGIAKLPRQERMQRVNEMCDLFGLQGLAHRRPSELSGGQQQRVALARALAIHPRLLLLDEPFAALDTPLRASLRQEVLQLAERLRLKILLVSHDLTDAFTLGQHVIVYEGGRIIQQGTREEVFFRPTTARVAELVGTGNILPARVERIENGTLWLNWQGQRVAASPMPFVIGSPVYVCIRPTQIMVIRPDRLAKRERENLFFCVIVNKQMQAETYTLQLRVDGSESAHDLELELPAYVYHRLSLDTETHALVELRRQDLHVIPREPEKQPRIEEGQHES